MIHDVVVKVSPAIVNGTAYIGSFDGNLAVDAERGAIKWKFETQGLVSSSPAVAGGLVYFGSYDGILRGPSIHNQEGITSSAAVEDGIVYFGCRDSHLYFVDAETGRRITEFFGGGGWISNSPAVKDGKVYFGGGSDRRFQWLDSADEDCEQRRLQMLPCFDGLASSAGHNEGFDLPHSSQLSERLARFVDSGNRWPTCAFAGRANIDDARSTIRIF